MKKHCPSEGKPKKEILTQILPLYKVGFFPPAFLGVESHTCLCEALRTFTLKTFNFEKMPLLFTLSTEFRGIHPFVVLGSEAAAAGLISGLSST